MERTKDQVSDEALIIDHGPRHVYRVSGEDAVEWLQRTLTADLALVRDRRGAHSLMLDRLGKIQAEFAVIARADALLLVLLGGAPELVMQHMKRLIVMEDVELGVTSGHLASFYGRAKPGVDRIAECGEAFVPFELDGLFPDGAVLSLDVESARFRAELERLPYPTVGEEAWEALRIGRGIPAFGQDFTSADNPGQAGLLTSAVSMTKGCYLGQEVVCKLVMRGALREQTCRIRFDELPAVGSEITIEGADGSRSSMTRIGTVTSVGPKRATGVWALGRVRCSAIEARAAVWAEQVRGRIDPVTSTEGC